MNRENLRILGVVGARSGSKSLPHKNIMPILGKPMLAWIIEAAKRSKYISRIVISTDSPEYRDIAVQYGAEAPFLRPAEISGDHSPDFDWLHHAAVWLNDNEQWKADVIVRLPPTSPLCRTEEIDACIEKLLETPDATASYTVLPAPKHPYKLWRRDGDRIKPFFNDELTGFRDAFNHARQLLPKAYFYIDSSAIKWDTLVEQKRMAGDNVVFYEIPEGVDIDVQGDVDEVERILRERHGEAQ
jgi:CMP-N,N'-diacetyllegionaminic acid synthase